MSLQIGEKYRNASATMVGGIPNKKEKDYYINLSHNKDEYWYSSHIVTSFGHIDKNHKVGKKITEMVEQKKDAKEIFTYLDKEFIKIMDIEDVYALIGNARKEGFQDGVNENKRAIKEALGF